MNQSSSDNNAALAGSKRYEAPQLRDLDAVSHTQVKLFNSTENGVTSGITS